MIASTQPRWSDRVAPASSRPSGSLIPFDAYSGRALMAMDVYTDRDRCWAEIDVPGVDPSSVEVSLDGSILRVLARRSRRDGASSEIEVGEREHGLFSREFLVSEEIRLEDVGILFEHGVLTITVPERSASSTSQSAALS